MEGPNIENHRFVDMPTGFASDLVPLIREGKKTFTYRLDNAWNELEVGDRVLTSDSGTGKVFAELEILSKENSTFGELPNKREGHEEYASDEERRETFSRYYKREIHDSDPATVFQFKVVRLIDQ